ncbi:MAG TPA: transglutaminase domain-containing protein [Thermodesulfobacteriota bacterium]
MAGLAALLLAPGAIHRTAESPWVFDLSLDLDSPDAVATYMLRRFSFRDDRDLYGVAERFVPPDEFLARGAGDCDDWAWFAAAVLAKQGYPTWLVSVWREEADRAGNTGHMVAAYLAADGWGYVSTEGHVAAQAASIAELAERVSPRWLGASIWTYRGRTEADPWNGWRPSVWVANRPAVRGVVGAFGTKPVFTLTFRRGLDQEVRLASQRRAPESRPE